MLTRQQTKQLMNSYICNIVSRIHMTVPVCLNDICFKYLWLGWIDKYISIISRDLFITNAGEVQLPHLVDQLYFNRYVHSRIMICPMYNLSAILKWTIKINIPYQIAIGVHNSYWDDVESCEFVRVPMYAYTLSENQHDMMEIQIQLKIKQERLIISTQQSSHSAPIYIRHHDYLHLILKIYGKSTLNSLLTVNRMCGRTYIQDLQVEHVNELCYATHDRFWQCKPGMVTSDHGNMIQIRQESPYGSMGNAHGFCILCTKNNPRVLASWILQVNSNQIWIGIHTAYKHNGIEKHYGWFGDINSSSSTHTMCRHDIIRMVFDASRTQLRFIRNQKQIFEIHDIDSSKRYHLVVSIPFVKSNYVKLLYSNFENCEMWMFAK